MKVSSISTILFFLVFSLSFVFSQEERKSSSLFEKKEIPFPTVQAQQGLAFEDVVNPSEYYVGPSDIISVNIWISPPLSFSLTVTPEGTLIVPTVGAEGVGGCALITTLADALDVQPSELVTVKLYVPV